MKDVIQIQAELKALHQWAKINKLVKPQQQINFDQLEKEAKEFFKKEIKNQLNGENNVNN